MLDKVIIQMNYIDRKLWCGLGMINNCNKIVCWTDGDQKKFDYCF